MLAVADHQRGKRRAKVLLGRARRGRRRGRARLTGHRTRHTTGRPQHDVILDLGFGGLHALSLTLNLEHWLRIARRRHDVSVGRLLDSLNSRSFGSYDETNHLIWDRDFFGDLMGARGR